jgi:quinolinate synthase
MRTNETNIVDYLSDLPPVHHEVLNKDRQEQLTSEIGELLLERDAVLVAHYYTDGTIQSLADSSGGYVSDSLDMARFGREHEAKTLVVAGVRFMGETAKILSPDKTILTPDLNANCSLDLGCDPDEFSAFCDQHPDRTIVVYANTSARVKARADWMVTSGSALDVVNFLHEKGDKILWAPDRHLGNYIESQTGADMLLWNASCVVHDEFKGEELANMRLEYPDARVLVHPESPASVIAQADYVGSTSGLIREVRESSAKTFIIATDKGIFHKMRAVAPTKILLEAPTAGKGATCRSCAECPWMAMNSLVKIRDVLRDGSNEIVVPFDIAQQARIPIERLLEFSKKRKIVVIGNNDA